MSRLLQITGLMLSLSCHPFANAHFVWLQYSGDRVQVHFSEAADAPEPELLPSVAAAQVWAVLSDRRGETSLVEVPVTLADDSLSGPVDPQATAVLLSHEYGVVTKGKSTFLLKYLAKQHLSPLPGNWSAVGDTVHLPLEITPAWQGRQLQLTVTWQGRPASGIEIQAVGCGLEEKLTTDARGIVHCEPRADGLLSVRAKHIDPTSGERQGEKYAELRTYSTLTLSVTRPTVNLLTHTLPPLPQGITSFGAAIIGSDLYVYGGHFGQAHHYSAEGQSNELRRISLTTAGAAWELVSSGPRLTGLAMVEYKGRLYRVGGFTAKNSDDEDQSLWSQDSFAMFDPASGRWTDLPSLPAGRSSHDAAVMDGKLYVVGGWNMQGPDQTEWHTTGLVCDLNQPELKWAELPAPGFQRRAVSLAAWRGRLYVVGGMHSNGRTTTDVSVFDPASHTWSAGPALLGTGMEGFGTSAFAADDRLVVTSMSGAIQTLAHDGSHWIVAGQTAAPRFFHRQLTTADGRLLLVGGASMQTGKTNSVELLQLAGSQ